MERKLVTIRKIGDLLPIPGADAIETAMIDGWSVVVKKGEFNVGDRCVYFEIDSFLPTGNPAWQFLVDKQSREFEGVVGHRLRTIRLRKQLSQGLALKVDLFPELKDAAEQTDLAALLDVKKWEAPLPAQLAGQAEGLFPSFIQKTDQERCQNIGNQIFGYEERHVPFDASLVPEQTLAEMLQSGKFFKNEDGSISKLLPAQASPDDEYEITIKLDGSSMTAFCDGGYYGDEVHYGVCSRNLELKDNEANADNAFVKMFNQSGLKEALKKTGLCIAVQGELIGPNIQGNRENLTTHKFFIFDIQYLSPDSPQYATASERYALIQKLYDAGLNPEIVQHVPVLYPRVKLAELNLKNVQDLLKFAEGPSLNNPVREGVVFKRVDGKFSFKAISNAYLLGEKE